MTETDTHHWFSSINVRLTMSYPTSFLLSWNSFCMMIFNIWWIPVLIRGAKRSEKSVTVPIEGTPNSRNVQLYIYVLDVLTFRYHLSRTVGRKWFCIQNKTLRYTELVLERFRNEITRVVYVAWHGFSTASLWRMFFWGWVWWTLMILDVLRFGKVRYQQ